MARDCGLQFGRTDNTLRIAGVFVNTRILVMKKTLNIFGLLDAQPFYLVRAVEAGLLRFIPISPSEILFGFGEH